MGISKHKFNFYTINGCSNTQSIVDHLIVNKYMHQFGVYLGINR